MKAKRLQHYLSIMALLHMIFVACLVALVPEIFAPQIDRLRLICSLVATFFMIACIYGVYSVTNRGTSNDK